MKTKSILYIRGIPEPLKRDFKSWCSKRGISMTDGVKELMKQASLIDPPDFVVEAKKNLEKK